MMRLASAIALAGSTMMVPVLAQDTKAASPEPKTAQAADRQAPAPLKLQLVFTRMQGDKKISSIPYAFWLADDRLKSNLRMGNQIPIPDGKGTYSYRDIGTNIDAVMLSNINGVYTVNIILTDSSVFFPDKSDPATASLSNSGMPAFRSFTANFSVMLRDGQSGQYLSATDQVTGQVTKLDATLTVLK
jgi:hypothetical protein